MRALLIAALLLAAPAHAEQVVRIGWLRATDDLALSKARATLEPALGKLGARVEWAGPFAAAAPAVEAINADAIDITVGSSTSSVASLAANAPIVIFAYQRMGPQAEAILVKAASPIHSIADLAGHSVAVNRGGTGEYLLLRALETHGVDPARVRRVYLGPADAGAAFASGAVDAIAAWDPFLTIALTTYDARVLADGAQIGSENAVVTIARRGFATAHPDLLRAVYATLLADNAWSLANKQAAGLVWAHELRVPDALATALGEHNAVPTGPAGPAQAEQIDHIANWYVRSGIIAAKPVIAGSTVDLGTPQGTPPPMLTAPALPP